MQTERQDVNLKITALLLDAKQYKTKLEKSNNNLHRGTHREVHSNKGVPHGTEEDTGRH